MPVINQIYSGVIRPGKGPRVEKEPIEAGVTQAVASASNAAPCIIPVADFPSIAIPPINNPVQSIGASFYLFALWTAGTMDHASSGNFTWTKDDVALPVTTESLLAEKTGVLPIIIAEAADSGVYKCVFNGRCGTASASVEIFVS